jgi:PAS domain S-box-containing protein
VVTLAIVVAAWAPIVWVVQVPGPFAETGSAPLVVLQTYVGIISMTTLTLFASVTERHHAQLSGAATRERLVEQGAALTRMVTAETMGSSDFRTSLRRITAEVSATLRAERVGVWLTSDDGSTMRCIEQCERGAGHSEGGVLSATDYPRYWQALRAKAAISADDAVSDPRTSEFAETYLIPYGITSMLDAIVCAGEGQPSGVLCVEHVGPPRHWETDEETFARSAAALVAQVLAGSARREAELALLERERRHRSVTESLSEGLLITNLDDVVEDVNPQMLSMTGYTREELVGRRAVDVLVPPEARDRLKGRNRVRAAGRAEHYEQRLRRKDGTEFWALIAGSPLRDAEGVVIGTVGANLDITERKRAEEATRASEERYRSLVEHMGEGLIQVDEGDFIQLVNPKICRMLGYSEAEMLGQHASTLLNREEDRAAMAARNRRRLDGVAEGYEVQLRKKSGEFLTVWNTATPVVSAEGRSVGSMAIITDITERKRADAERQRLEAMLRQSQKLEAVGTLAGGIAHGFNNLLGTVSGNLSLALQDVPAGHPARESLDQIGQACARATDLVRQILAFSRNDVLEKRALDVRTSVDETVRLLRATLPAGVDLVVQVGDGVPNVLADPTGIQQVLLNVCTNAWHAMAGQPGRITIRLDGVTFEAEQAIGHAALGPGRYVRLSVSDTGAGMDRATLERIFDPFFTTKGVGKGTGLGLSVVHGIMEHHGGTVSVTSQPGKGSTFDLYFPAIAQVVAEPLPAFQLGPRRGQGERILFLDDERPLVDMATRVLEREGFRVSGFTSPVDAVAALRADPMAFDLLVTDQNMPAVAGIDVAREAHGIRADLPVVLTSGNVTPELQRLASAAGVLEILSKPYGTGSFAQLVATLVHAER